MLSNGQNVKSDKVLMKYIDLNQVLEINSYYDSLSKWFNNLRQTINNQELISSYQKINNQEFCTLQEKTIQHYFNKYLVTIKPVIYNFNQLTSKLDPQYFGFYSKHLHNVQQKELLVNIFQSLNKFSILTAEQIQPLLIVQQSQSISTKSQQIQTKTDKSLIYSFDELIQIDKDLSQKIKPKQNLIYKMNLLKNPQNQQVKWWNRTLRIKQKSVQGIVIKGKGIGKQQLGMPTANIQLPKQQVQKLITYPNGIYVSRVSLNLLQGEQKTYLGASSLGTNPHYQNSTKNRILQIYIIEQNENKETSSSSHNSENQNNNINSQCDKVEMDLYGKEIRIDFIQLIRLQLKFRTFDSFLNSMRNDIYVTSLRSSILNEQNINLK